MRTTTILSCFTPCKRKVFERCNQLRRVFDIEKVHGHSVTAYSGSAVNGIAARTGSADKPFVQPIQIAS